jgi:glutaryl-CoA dehydrogenase
MLNEMVRTYEGFDFFKLDNFMTEDQRALRDRVRAYVEEVVKPNIAPYWDAAEFPREIVMPMKDLGIMGGLIRGWGSAGLDPLEMGLTMYELAKGDGSVSTFYGVQSGLAMSSIGLLGSDEQRERWLPRMATLDLIGAFGLTEPKVGSNAAGIQTQARRDGDTYILNGAKRWIGNASLSDVLIIWARG